MLEKYDIFYLTPGLQLKDVNCFLLGERHDLPSTMKLNGDLVREIGGDSPMLFCEIIPSMMEAPLVERERNCQELGISTSIVMLGWDGSPETCELIGGHDLDIVNDTVEENLAEIQKGIQVFLGSIQEILNSNPENQFLVTRENIETILQGKPLVEAYLHLNGPNQSSSWLKKKIVKRIGFMMEVYNRLCKNEKIFEKAIERGIKGSALQFTFPERTQAMVATLEKIRTVTSKYFSLQAHCIYAENPAFLIQEFELSPLYTELEHHKAAILVPRSVNNKVLW